MIEKQKTVDDLTNLNGLGASEVKPVTHFISNEYSYKYSFKIS